MITLGHYEAAQLRRLPAGLQRIVVNEMTDPESYHELVLMLRGPNPEGTIGRTLTREIMEAMSQPPGTVGMGWSLKKIFKKVINTVVSVHQQIAKKILPKPLQKVDAAIVKTVQKVNTAVMAVQDKVDKEIKRSIPIWAPIVGAVFAPFTFGLSAVAAEILVASRKYYLQRKAAIDAKKAAKADAAAQDAQASQQQTQLNQQLDQFYNQNQNYFTQAGYPPSKWQTMSTDDKVNTIDLAAKGQLQPVNVPNTPNGIVDPNLVVQQNSPQGQQSQALASQAQAQNSGTDYSSLQSAASSASSVPPSEGVQGGDGGAAPPSPPLSPPPGVTYRLDVEGKTVAGGLGSDQISDAVLQNTTPGDRFEVFDSNGKSAGLRIRTGTGVISIPSDQAPKVKAMSREGVLQMMASASDKAGGGGSGVILLLAVPAVAIGLAAKR